MRVNSRMNDDDVLFFVTVENCEQQKQSSKSLRHVCSSTEFLLLLLYNQSNTSGNLLGWDDAMEKKKVL